MHNFNEFLDKMGEPLQRDKMEEILDWVSDHYPSLKKEIKWNQPIFTDHGTYIIGFSHSKQHIALSPEVKPMNVFAKEIEATGLSHTQNIIRIKWADEIPYELMKTLIDYNLEDKGDYDKFWREPS